MDQVNAKVYYDILTGEPIVITCEGQGDGLRQTTKKEDFEKYLPLKSKSFDQVEFIELEFGTLERTFENIKNYSVNVETKQLQLEYYTAEELQKTENEKQAIEELKNRATYISEYLLESPTSIADVESYILQNEINKIMEGMS